MATLAGLIAECSDLNEKIQQKQKEHCRVLKRNQHGQHYDYEQTFKSKYAVGLGKYQRIFDDGDEIMIYHLKELIHKPHKCCKFYDRIKHDLEDTGLERIYKQNAQVRTRVPFSDSVLFFMTNADSNVKYDQVNMIVLLLKAIDKFIDNRMKEFEEKDQGNQINREVVQHVVDHGFSNPHSLKRPIDREVVDEMFSKPSFEPSFEPLQQKLRVKSKLSLNGQKMLKAMRNAKCDAKRAANNKVKQTHDCSQRHSQRHVQRHSQRQIKNF